MDTRAYLLAIVAMNVRTMLELAALAPDLQSKKANLERMRQGTLQYIDQIMIPLLPGEGEEVREPLKQEARKLVTSLLSAAKFQ